MTLESLKQLAVDYTLGILPKEDAILFEARIEEDEVAQQLLTNAQDGFAKLSLTAPPSQLGKELRERVLAHTHPAMDLDPFLESRDISFLRENFKAFDSRYSGGGVSADISDLKNKDVTGNLEDGYQSLVKLLPLLAGDSRAAAGDFTDLQNFLRGQDSFSDLVSSTLEHTWSGECQASRSVLRTALATLPSLSFFSDRLRGNQPSLADTRRLFYLCRDQLKIMRASFRDLDPARLVEDEKIRLHGAGLLRSKWWGAEHAFFSSKGTVKCGHFFDGPITERCVEFAEYDANMYCLANLLSPRSSNGEFHFELLKDTVPGCTLAVATAPMDDPQYESLRAVIERKKLPTNQFIQDQFLWDLIEDSMSQGHKCTSNKELREQKAYGYNRMGGTTYLWFAWPAISSAQDGADAVTGNPLQ